MRRSDHEAEPAGDEVGGRVRGDLAGVEPPTAVSGVATHQLVELVVPVEREPLVRVPTCVTFPARSCGRRENDKG